jgi:hypothetical protein
VPAPKFARQRILTPGKSIKWPWVSQEGEKLRNKVVVDANILVIWLMIAQCRLVTYVNWFTILPWLVIYSRHLNLLWLRMVMPMRRLCDVTVLAPFPIEGNDQVWSQTIDICTIIFSIVTCNTSTKAGRRSFTYPRALNLCNCRVHLCSANVESSLAWSWVPYVWTSRVWWYPCSFADTNLRQVCSFHLFSFLVICMFNS